YRPIHPSGPVFVSRLFRRGAPGWPWRRVGTKYQWTHSRKPITIPSSTLSRIAEEIAASGHVARPYIGVVMQPVEIPESLQKKAGVNANAGLLVMHVESGGPADQAGVLLGDLLLDMEGQSFSDLEDVYQALGQKRAGQEVQT